MPHYQPKALPGRPSHLFNGSHMDLPIYAQDAYKNLSYFEEKKFQTQFASILKSLMPLASALEHSKALLVP